MTKPVGNKQGITLVELLVVISIVSLLAAAVAFSYNGWTGRYSAENEVNQIFSDLSQARSMAMQQGRDYFVQFSNDAGGNTSYKVYEDTSPPQGNGVLDTTGSPSDTLVSGPVDMKYPLQWQGNDTLVFDSRGLINTTPTSSSPFSWTIEIKSSRSSSTTENADEDCLVLADTMLNLGKWDISSGGCDVK